MAWGVLLFSLLGDWTVIGCARKILKDFLRGGVSRQRFEKICRAQPLWQKALLRFVGSYIRTPAFFRPYRFYSAAYLLYLALIPLKPLWLFRLEARDPGLGAAVCALYTLLWGLVFSIEAPGKRHSRYAGRKYRK